MVTRGTQKGAVYLVESLRYFKTCARKKLGRINFVNSLLINLIPAVRLRSTEEERPNVLAAGE